MDELLPWEVDGLPKEISRKDLEKAERYFMTGTFWWNDQLIPVAPDHHGAYFRLTGLRYEHNVKRLVKLIKNYKPMYSDSYCGLVAQHYYPAVLLPDPTKPAQGTSARPVAVCSHSGYIGSAWQEPATKIRPEVDRAHDRRQLIITRLRLQEIPADVVESLGWELGWEPAVWLPCDPLPP